MSEEISSMVGRFPTDARSVIEAARSIEPRNGGAPWSAVRGVLKPVYKYVRWRWNRPPTWRRSHAGFF